jgi:hypothetical protein
MEDRLKNGNRRPGELPKRVAADMDSRAYAARRGVAARRDYVRVRRGTERLDPMRVSLRGSAR